MKKDAIVDATRKYRYVLKRQWGTDDNNFVNFVLVNPSTADEITDDPTIKTCIKLSQRWGYDGIWITNLFAFRATKPTDLKVAIDPIGKRNDSYIKQYAERSKIVVVAWGNHGDFLNRNKHVTKILSQIKAPYCLKVLKNGSPKHPLYTHGTTELIEFITKNQQL